MSTQPEKKENKLNELYEQGKAKGTMTYDEIITKLSTTDIDPDQFDTVLETLEAMGVEILTCGTCLNHYGLTEKLQVGEVTNMYVITEKMMQADLIVKP